MNATNLLGTTTIEAHRTLHLLEKHRVESFKDWPFPSTSTCSIVKMAEAGFYWTGTKRENDAVTCFVCSKTLDGWETDDDPWTEHLKHAPQCPFAKMRCTQNDMNVKQFLKIVGIVFQNGIENKINKFKSQLLKEHESKVEEFTQHHA